MPNLSNCKQVNGKLYCWDKDKQCLVEVIIQRLTEYSGDVLAAFTEPNDSSNLPHVEHQEG